MKFRTELKAEIDVEFVDPEKTKAYFIDGDWKNFFFSYNDLEDLAEGLSFAFDADGDSYNSDYKEMIRDPEGYGIYVKQYDESYKLPDHIAEETGQIIIRYERELDLDGTYSL